MGATVVFFIFLAFAIKVSAQEGFLNLACGSTTNYSDKRGLTWISDVDYISTGNSSNIPLDGPEDFKTLRRFPLNLNKSCYKLPVQHLSFPYLLKLWFAALDRDVGFNYSIETQGMLLLDTPDVPNKKIPNPHPTEWILRPSAPELYVCLIRTNDFVDPYISALQLIVLNPAMYSDATKGVALRKSIRYDLGNQESSDVRYTDDEFDRTWNPFNHGKDFHTEISTKNTTNLPPMKVMKTATAIDTLPVNVANNYEKSNTTIIFAYVTYISSIPQMPPFHLNVDDGKGNSSRTLLNFNDSFVALEVRVPLNRSEQYTLSLYSPGPINEQLEELIVMNALEVYFHVDTDPSTAAEDVNVLKELNATFSLNFSSWISDPCYAFPWQYISCNGTRISSLYLSGQNLTGRIPSSIGKFTALVSLDLSNNHLQGPLPDLSNLTMVEKIYLQNNNLNGNIPAWLSRLKNLKEVFLQNNNFSGDMPDILRILLPNLVLKTDGNALLRDDKDPHPLLNPIQTNKRDAGNRKKKIIIIVSVVAGFLIVTLVALLITIIYFRKSKMVALNIERKDPSVIEANNTSRRQAFPFEELTKETENFSNCKVFSMDEITRATKNFSRKIGQGGFGLVFLGRLSGGKEVAVRMVSILTNQGKQDILNEVKLLSRISHENIVSLLGYCSESKDLMIVYEHMPGESLREHLYGGNSEARVLNWKERVKIALDVAQGLEYLHMECNPKIIHNDVSTVNILLDNYQNAKLSELGLSGRRMDREESSRISTTIKETAGYLDPEHTESGVLSDKSDIYSFGVVLFEMICGRQPINERLPKEEIELLKWVKPYVEKDDAELLSQIHDKKLSNKFHSIKSIQRVAKLALACIDKSSLLRPSANIVVMELKEALKEEGKEEEQGNE